MLNAWKQVLYSLLFTYEKSQYLVLIVQTLFYEPHARLKKVMELGTETVTPVQRLQSILRPQPKTSIPDFAGQSRRSRNYLLHKYAKAAASKSGINEVRSGTTCN